jgi:hypothetical protein
MAQPKLYHMGFRGQDLAQHLGQCQPVARLAHLCRIFAQVLISTARSLYAKEDFGLDLQQAVYVMDSTVVDLCLALFPWAKLPQAQGSYKAAHLVGPARQYPDRDHHHSRQPSRCKDFGPNADRARGHPNHGSWLPRLLSIVPNPSGLDLFRDPLQAQHVFPTHHLASGGQSHRRAMRPKHHLGGPTKLPGLSREATPHSVLRPRDRQTNRSNHRQQLVATGHYHWGIISVSLASG